MSEFCFSATETTTPGHAAYLRRMTRIAAAGLALLVLSPPAVFADRTDVLVLRNGDRITGEVKKLLGGRLEFKTDKADTLKVKWDAVAQLTSTLFFEVILDDTRRLYGELRPPTSDGTLRVGTNDQAVDAPLRRIAQIVRLHRSFWSRLKGSVDLGLSYTKAEDKTEWDFGAQTSYLTPKRKISLSLASTLSRSDFGDFDRDDFTGSFQRFWGGAGCPWASAPCSATPSSEPAAGGALALSAPIMGHPMLGAYGSAAMKASGL